MQSKTRLASIKPCLVSSSLPRSFPLCRKFLKGEIDVLLADPSGVATVMLEVKTASGNPFLALYEDVVR